MAVMPILMAACGSSRMAVSPASSRGTGDSLNSVFSAVVYNDSVYSILRGASAIKYYRMKGFVQDSVAMPCDSLLGYPIEQDRGKLDKSSKLLLQFIVEDPAQYVSNYPAVRHPFWPNMAFEFISGHQRVYYFVSFATDEVGIATARGDFRFYRSKGIRQLAHWAYRLMPEDKYYQLLIKNR